jgi:hypothetical protein
LNEKKYQSVVLSGWLTNFVAEARQLSLKVSGALTFFFLNLGSLHA